MGKSRKTDKGRLRENRGTGRGKDYSSWLKVGEISGSSSRSHRPFSFKTHRVYHLLSDLELYFFLLMIWDANVIDIREQYPLLPLLKTELIASQLGYRHPTPPGRKLPIVMTTDFIVTRSINDKFVDEAIAIKSEADLSNPRTREKMAIERQFWIEKEIRWRVVTDSEMPIQKAKNLKRLYNINYSLEIIELSTELIEEFRKKIKTVFEDNPNLYHNMAYVCQVFDKYNGLLPGTGLKLLMYLIWEKKVVIDLNIPIKFGNLKIREVL